MKRLLLPLILILISGCSPKMGLNNKSIGENIPVWSKSKDGLRIGVIIQDNELNMENKNLITLVFQNISEKPIRIYFLKNHFFRSFQSHFYLEDNQKRKQSITPLSPPHGYVVGEKDFHLIQPSEKMSFTHPINIPKRFRKRIHSQSKLTWIYQNKVFKWEGGHLTLDGSTKRLFNGKTIPYIWRGRLELNLPVKLKNNP